jgi:photosystem II stability/assembly factor-like uncharacterized protein
LLVHGGNLLGSNDRRLFVQEHSAVYYSEDGGGTWKNIEGVTSVSRGSGFVLDSLVIICSVKGLVRSTDDGRTWEALPVLRKYLYGMRGNDEEMYGIDPRSTFDMIWRSSDRGRTWNEYSIFNVNNLVLTDSTIMILEDRNNAPDNRRYIWIKNTSDSTWRPVDTAFIGVHPLAIGASNKELYVGSDDGRIRRSSDAGSTWSEVRGFSEFEEGEQIRSIVASGSLVLFFTENKDNERLHRSTDGGISWTRTDRGPVNRFVYVLTMQRDSLLVGTEASLLYRAHKKARDWTTVPLEGAGVRISGLFTKGDTIVAGTFTNGIYRSFDNGATWSKANKGISDMYVSTMTSIDTLIFVGTNSGGVFTSLDYGTSWTPVNNGLRKSDITNIVTDGTRLYAASYKGGIFRSDDLARSWQDVSKGVEGKYVWCIAVNRNSVYLGTEYGVVVRSRDRGVTWQDVGPGGPFNVNSLVAVGDTVVLGSDDGRAFISRNDGNTWTEQSSGLPGVAVLTLFHHDGVIFAGTYGKGVYLFSLKDIATSVDDGEALSSNRLHEGSPQPNPASEEVVVRFDGDENGDEISHVSVFDRLGHEWTSPSIGTTKDARGAVTIRWRCSEVPTGMYLLHLRSGRTHRVTKIHVVH